MYFDTLEHDMELRFSESVWETCSFINGGEDHSEHRPGRGRVGAVEEADPGCGAAVRPAQPYRVLWKHRCQIVARGFGSALQ